MRLYLLFLIAVASFSCGNTANVNAPANAPVNTNRSSSAAVPVYDFQIVNEYPHDPTAFTQGLEYHEGFLYEGTGGSRSNPVQEGANARIYSSLRKVDYKTGKVLMKHDVPSDFFGEGITILGDKIYQVTWHEGTAFVYNLSDFKLQRELRYQGQGWGLTNDGTNLYMSDGTHVIRVMNPADFSNVRQIIVNDEKGKPIVQLNELEMVNGEIWANIWQTGWIIRIDPQTGKLLGRVDINKLADDVSEKDENADVLNGIAYDKAGDRLFITGKLWKKLYEIKVSVR